RESHSCSDRGSQRQFSRECARDLPQQWLPGGSSSIDITAARRAYAHLEPPAQGGDPWRRAARPGLLEFQVARALAAQQLKLLGESHSAHARAIGGAPAARRPVVRQTSASDQDYLAAATPGQLHSRPDVGETLPVSCATAAHRQPVECAAIAV